MRPSLLCALALCALAGCGGGGGETACIYRGIRCENLPQRKLFRVGWTERIINASQPLAVFRVESIEIRPRGYTIRASFTNRSKTTFVLPRGGARSPIDFGLGVYTDAIGVRVEDPGNYLLRAESIAPRMPRVLAPGATWRGTMSSATPPRARRWVRPVFGVFFFKGKPPYGLGPFFIYATSHNLQVPKPVGSATPAS